MSSSATIAISDSAAPAAVAMDLPDDMDTEDANELLFHEVEDLLHTVGMNLNNADLEALRRTLLRDMNRVGRGNHNNGVICTPDKLRKIIRLAREYTYNGKIHWKELAEDHFPGEVNVIRNVFRRWLTAARLEFPNANTGTSISRCSKIGCGLLKRGHICLAPLDAEDMKPHAKKRLHHESDAYLMKLAQKQKRTLTFAEANDEIVRKNGLDATKHVFNAHMFGSAQHTGTDLNEERTAPNAPPRPGIFATRAGATVPRHLYL